MNKWLLELCQRIAETKGSIALHESLYVYPLVETAHVLSICLFLGTLFIVDFRLLGWSFNTVSITEVCKRILPYSIFGFILMIITGALLFYAIPVRTYQSIFFRVKIILLIIAAFNAFLFHRKLRNNDKANYKSTTFSKTAAVTSLIAWSGVIIMGRMIAYNWFDCDKSNVPSFIVWFSGCYDTIESF